MTTPAIAPPEELLGPLTELGAPVSGNGGVPSLRPDGRQNGDTSRIRWFPTDLAAGLEWTRLVTEALVDGDVTVVSGLASDIEKVAPGWTTTRSRPIGERCFFLHPHPPVLPLKNPTGPARRVAESPLQPPAYLRSADFTRTRGTPLDHTSLPCRKSRLIL